ncbi:FkbM family methyltransferase [Haloferula rosea]|uniref:FkbM family methyltransferase n=1 Tax=Haloferula rosea TaxID=490093 RepID=A0A934RE07_9BACT|nr:FkbM family methyltransferase [Haloferula rosea]MBK1827817.1 FkbM family methyltransferase [Haloferula rosea]
MAFPMITKLKIFLRDRFPVTRLLKSWWVAAIDSLFGVRESYAQTGEDRIISRILGEDNIESSFYIDVGANHPTKLSNTYRLYREGFSGLIIEPNRKLVLLHRIFRSRDIQLAIGCGDETKVLEFQHATSHVLSGFQSEGLKAKDFSGTELMPVLPLDLIVQGLDVEEIAVLSIDVEGFDLQVVKGAAETLAKTRIVVVEHDEEDHELIPLIEQAGFKLVEQTRHNAVLKRVRSGVSA